MNHTFRRQENKPNQTRAGITPNAPLVAVIFSTFLSRERRSLVGGQMPLKRGAAILLLATRYHRLAQIGSWWAGVLYSVLILRWITFNSVFL